jgi:RecJ-like exonuclease
MENFESDLGGYVVLCDRCGTAKGVRANYLCDPCDKVWNSDEGPRWDDHLEASDIDADHWYPGIHAGWMGRTPPVRPWPPAPDRTG